MKFRIEEDIRKAKTLHKDFYFSDSIWEQNKESIFASSWQCLGDTQELFQAGIKSIPQVFMPQYLNEPILLTLQDENIKLMSNVCTHRGFILSHHPSETQSLTCKYHGRRFSLDGTCQFMPEFKDVENFPSPCDHLKDLKHFQWNQFLFGSLNGSIDINKAFSQVDERVGFLNTHEFTHFPVYDKVYTVHAHWALYCENYLEGFHIPFVHHDLNALIDYGNYDTLCENDVVLQIGYGSDEANCFILPEGHPDHGQKVAAYYYWLFPNLMLNYYTWGLQLNYIMPVNKNLTKVHFVYYLKDPSDPRFLNGDKLGEKTEREDEFVVEGVQKGLRSRFYDHGRYSPRREKGVHHFHRLLSAYL